MIEIRVVAMIASPSGVGTRADPLGSKLDALMDLRAGARRQWGGVACARTGREKETMMAIRKQYCVCLENKPGELARLCRALAAAKVNILAISVNENADCGCVRFVADKPAAAKAALVKIKVCFKMRDVVVAMLPNAPGALAKAAGKLAKAKINIDYVYGTTVKPGGDALCVFAVDDTAKAGKAIG